MNIELRKYPTKDDLMWMKECTVGTMGKEAKTVPTSDFLRNLLVARHSPIRELLFSYVIRDIPYWVSVHLVRHHVGFQLMSRASGTTGRTSMIGGRLRRIPR